MKKKLCSLGLITVMLMMSLTSCGKKAESNGQKIINKTKNDFQVKEEDWVIMTYKKNSCRKVYQGLYDKYYQHKEEAEFKEADYENQADPSIGYMYCQGDVEEGEYLYLYLRDGEEYITYYAGEIEIEEGNSNPTEEKICEKVQSMIKELGLDDDPEYHYELDCEDPDSINVDYEMRGERSYVFQRVYQGKSISHATYYPGSGFAETGGDVSVIVKDGKIITFSVFGFATITEVKEDPEPLKYASTDDVIQWMEGKDFGDGHEIQVKDIKLVYAVNPKKNGTEDLVPMADIYYSDEHYLIPQNGKEKVKCYEVQHLYLNLSDGTCDNVFL